MALLKRLLITALPLAAFLSPMAAQAAPRAGVEVSQPWSRPATAGATGAGFMTLTNRGKAAAVLTGVESPVAQRTEIHRTEMSGGVMRMGRQAQVAIPPGGRLAFAPGGYHLMLFGLRAPLKPGDKAPATLVFADGSRVKVDFLVGSGLGPPTAHRH